MTVESLMRPPTEGNEINLAIGSDRRADIEIKQVLVASLLREANCDGLLLLEPDNFAWFTSGASSRGVLDPETTPALFCTSEARWILSPNMDTQRLFDEEVDGLGFQLKEWPWFVGRESFLMDLCHNRRIACDRALGDCLVLTDLLRQYRRALTPYEQACMKALGQLVAHAVEATARTLERGLSEREVAGQLAHRLVHRGAHVVHVGVAADGRSRLYRRFGFTPARIERYAVLTATARKYGLTVTTSRMVCFGEPPSELRQDGNAVCRVSAAYVAATWPDAVPREILLAGRRIYLVSGYEHEWQLTHQGHTTGRTIVEMSFTPQTSDLLQPGWAVVWMASAGAALSCDTFLVADEGAQLVTPTETWPLKRIRIQGSECIRPDILQR